MSDLIDRQAVIDCMMRLQREDEEAYGASIPEGFDGDRAAEALMQLPSAHPEIIRCKDCLMHGVCRFKKGLGLDGYCSQAERRTDE